MLCPICKKSLNTNEVSATCASGHCFDTAKEGYYNLLSIKGKNSLNPGDNKEMIFARRDFLRSGFYETLSDEVNKIAAELLFPKCEELMDNLKISTEHNNNLNMSDEHNNNLNNLPIEQNIALNASSEQNNNLNLPSEQDIALSISSEHNNRIHSSAAIDTLHISESNPLSTTIGGRNYTDISLNNSLTKGERKPTIVDAGCSVGYYCNRLQYALGSQKQNFYAFDIAKDAVKIAAKSNCGITYFVASVYDLPLEDGCADLALSIFSPLPEQTFSRIIKIGGYLLVVIPAVNHLEGLKTALYEKVQYIEEKIPSLDSFVLIDKKRLTYEITLTSSADIKNLLLMTPYYYKSPRAAVEKVLSMNTLTTALDFEIITFKKS